MVQQQRCRMILLQEEDSDQRNLDARSTHGQQAFEGVVPNRMDEYGEIS